MKICRKCRIGKSEDLFRANKNVKSGLHSWCKPCENELGKKWRSANPGYWRSYYENHRDRIDLRIQIRRAQKLNAVCRLTEAQWIEIKRLSGDRCVYCGRGNVRLTMDHVIPLSRGGEHTATNVVPACKSCNSRKGNRPAPAFTISLDIGSKAGQNVIRDRQRSS